VNGERPKQPPLHLPTVAQLHSFRRLRRNGVILYKNAIPATRRPRGLVRTRSAMRSAHDGSFESDCSGTRQVHDNWTARNPTRFTITLRTASLGHRFG
jgi:hypothetical protein